jgi:hypothetical protein
MDEEKSLPEKAGDITNGVIKSPNYYSYGYNGGVSGGDRYRYRYRWKSTTEGDADGTGYLCIKFEGFERPSAPSTSSRASEILGSLSRRFRRQSVLCWRCQLYDEYFDLLFAPSPLPRTVWNITHITPMSSDASCALCAALAILVAGTALQEGDGREVWITNVLTAGERQSSIERDVDTPMGIVVERHRAAFQRAFRNARSIGTRVRMDCQRDSMLLVERSKSSPYGAQRIHRSAFDALSVLSWVRDCCQNHPKCQTRANMSFEINVIDCIEGVVIRRKPSMPYLALSYVWGDISLAQGPRTFDLASAPRVIRDAMSVTTRLGHRYLWVDRYCIPQDDDSEKTYQIGIMHRIYENSIVTIVAAASEHDEDGLPGAGTNPPILRAEQVMVPMGSNMLISTRPGVREALKGSKWLTRGWTYQESLMSPRCLLFTKSKVFLVCKTTTMSESIPRLPLRAVYEDHDTIESLFGGLVDRTTQETPLDFLERSITTYLSRDLGQASDSLNAFKAMLSRFEYRSYWGIPLIFYELSHTRNSLNFEAYTLASRTRQAFLNGLCWSVQKQSDSWILYSNAKRRRDNPTWSWTSLKQAAIKFHQRRDHKQAPDWKYTVRCSDARVWLCNDQAGVKASRSKSPQPKQLQSSAPSLSFSKELLVGRRSWESGSNDEDDSLWSDVSERFLEEESHVLRESSPLLQLQTAVAEIVRVEIPTGQEVYRETRHQSYFAPQNEHFEWRGAIHVYTKGNEDDPRAYIPINLDCGEYEFDKTHDVSPGSSFKPSRWRIALIAETCIMAGIGFDPVPGTGNGWRKFFLVLQEKLGLWYRIGSAEITGDAELVGLTKQVMVLA